MRTQFAGNVINSKGVYKIENISESKICDAFIEASREVNPPFYKYADSKRLLMSSSISTNTARGQPCNSRTLCIVSLYEDCENGSCQSLP